MIDVEALLAPTAEESPCGPDLEYDAAFLALEQVSQGKPEQQFGSTVIEAEEPDWDAVRVQAEALFPRTKDLRVATLLTRALVRTEGFDGLQAGLLLVSGLIERYWEGVHPRLDPEDGFDPVMRMNALAPLGDAAGLVRDVREAVVVRARGQAVLVRDVEIALGKIPPRTGVEPMAMAVVEGMLAEAGVERLTRMVDTLQNLKALTTLLNDTVGSDRATDLKPLFAPLQALSQLAQGVRTAIGGNPVEEVEDAESPGSGEMATPGAKSPKGDITSRQDAVQILDKIIVFLERSEPANPAPILLRRAHRLMTMSFMDIIKDLAPESLDKIESLAGTPPGAS